MGTLTTAKRINLDAEDAVVNDTTPLTDVIESYFTRKRLSKRTVDFYSTHFNGYLDFLILNKSKDDVPYQPVLADLNFKYVNAYIRQLEQTPTKRYPTGSVFVTRAAAVSLKALGNWLVKTHQWNESPLKPVEKPKELEEVRQPLSDDEVERILSCLDKGTRDRAIVCTFLGTGVRLNELRELRISDLHLRDCQLFIRAETAKTKVARTVYFHKDTAAEIDAYLQTRTFTSDDPVFPMDEGRAFTIDGLPKVIAKVARESGVRRLHAHLFRHTWATNFMRSGGDLLTLKRLGGWKKMLMVERYSHAAGIQNMAVLPSPTSRIKQTKVVQFKRRTA